MTEQEWLTSEDPARMLRLLDHRNARILPQKHPLWDVRVSDRKLQLVNEAWDSDLCGDERWTMGSVHSHGTSSISKCLATETNIKTGYKPMAAHLLREIVGNPFRPVALNAKQVCALCGYDGGIPRHKYCERGSDPQGKNNHHWVTKADEPWLTPTAIDMSRHAYDSRDFGGLPVLADALEEAGCVGESCDCLNDWCPPSHRKPHPLLEHLRGPGPHVRGCFALDCLLGLD